jgi:hypothetical protein
MCFPLTLHSGVVIGNYYSEEAPVYGEIGNSTGGSVIGSLLINYYYFSDWTPTTAGTIRYLRANGSDSDGTGTACLTIWDAGEITFRLVLGNIHFHRLSVETL